LSLAVDSSNPALTDAPKLTAGDPFAAIGAGMTAIAAGWSAIASAFSTKTKSEIVQRIESKGYKYFEGNTNMQRLVGLKPQYRDRWIEKTIASLEMSNPKIADQLRDAFMFREATGLMMSIAYQPAGTGDTKYAFFAMTYDEPTDTTNWIVIDVKAKFQLAPDLLVVRKSLSVMGGIFESSKDVIQEIPRGMTMADADDVITMMTMLATSRLAKMYGITLPLPNT